MVACVSVRDASFLLLLLLVLLLTHVIVAEQRAVHLRRTAHLFGGDRC